MSLQSPAMTTLAASPQPQAPPSRPMSLKIYISGKFYDKENAKVSVYDHGLLYGDGVFEGMRSYGGTVFRLKQHLDRLWASAKGIWLKIPISQEELATFAADRSFPARPWEYYLSRIRERRSA